ncbi:DUF5694 domain-containing protein [Pontibacter sp. G13]|uniref:DUF5694 domain-containing protein n=1 Tax=Pontibacter sp. G13 TaxID=3074898 RepID=UPI00288BF1F9|nr:DUF5694 domain-containing protein [Pontibacter sp. G13]WNJ17748.1 DUF5694 domain-containing protein [Pontibacter sp. G13]
MKQIYLTKLLLVAIFAACSCHAQTTSYDPDTLKSAKDFFDFPKPQVLVMGTFHFNYPGLDAKKTSEEDKVDVLSEQRQLEVRELVEYIKQFKPTKICVETRNPGPLMKRFREYQAGTFELGRNEIYQVGYRLADEMALDTLYALDTHGFITELTMLDSTFVEEMAEGYDWVSDDLVDSLGNLWFNYDREILKSMTLLDYLKHINQPGSHESDYGMYLTGDFKLGKYRGADMVATYWYSRNLRIFRNVQEIVESPDDRILLIFGNAHAALFRQFLTCSPEFDYIEFDSL